MKRRKPQLRCVCGHAKSKHKKYNLIFDGKQVCEYCWDKCVAFRQDNLATLEKIYDFNQEKKGQIQ